jgi:hypothetical protein
MLGPIAASRKSERRTLIAMRNAVALPPGLTVRLASATQTV